MVDYDKILQDNADLKMFDGDRRSIHMVKHDTPVSITEAEFQFIHDFIVNQGYHTAYECATGFGMSACAIGLAMRVNRGHLQTIDSYVEEQFNQPMTYEDKTFEVFQNSDGYKVAQQLLKYFDIEGFVTLNIGSSPADVPEILKDISIDFAFIDAFHQIDNLTKDIEVIIPYLSKEASVMIHDAHTFQDGHLNHLASMMKMHYRRVSEIPIDKTYNLGIFCR